MAVRDKVAFAELPEGRASTGSSATRVICWSIVQRRVGSI